MNAKRILVIEDDPAIRLGLEETLREGLYDVESCGDGVDGFARAQSDRFDCILLDIMLPGKDGVAICRDLRAAGVRTPILMLTSKKTEIDKVLGLEIGADDYVTKPFGIHELRARIKALLRRSEPQATTPRIESAAFGDIELDFHKFEATKNGQPLRFSVKEFEILKFFVERSGEIITRETLLNEIWGYDAYPTTRTVDNYILSIRKKIEDNPSKPQRLITVHTAGYRFVQ